MAKYGLNKVFNPNTLHKKNIDRQSIEQIEENSNVLDIGCATGFMGEYLIKEKNCKVTGVDIGKSEVDQAKKVLTETILGDIEKDSTLKKLKKYDVVIASAVIEHLVFPEVALQNWKKLLKRNGKLVITTSNITHWTARLKILKGNFDYEQYGLFDNTHLHFYTPNTFRNLLKKTGYKIEHFSIDAVGGGYPKISQIGAKVFPNLFAHQILIVAIK